MKLGILTYFTNPNYGAMLQAYALWHVLKGRGHSVTFLDYDFGLSKPRPFCKCLWGRSFKVIKQKLSTRARFEITMFSKSFPRTAQLKNSQELSLASKELDAVVVGSDQVWNPSWLIARKDWDTHFLGFVPKGVARIAYAPSFGRYKWEGGHEHEINDLLSKFDAISVREISGKEIVKQLSGQDAEVVLDPTLLWDWSFYARSIAQTEIDVNRANPYVFKYFLDEWSDGHDESTAVATCCSSLGLECVESDRKPVKGISGAVYRLFKATSKVSVKDWLIRISKAEFVVTNSFHGTVFAILSHRPFASLLLKGSGMNERIISLLSQLGLENRMCYAWEGDKIRGLVKEPVDWRFVDSRLSELRAKSIDFLARSGL